MNQKETRMQTTGSYRSRMAGRYAIALSLFACAALPLGAAGGQVVANTAPSYVATATNLGPANPSTIIDVSIWLNLHNRGMLDTLAQQLYNPASPNYRHWLKPSDIAANFAPSAQEAAAVQQFFVSHNLKVVTVGPNNLFVRARGTVGDVGKAFQVQLNNYQVRGNTFRAPAGDPQVDGPAVGLVQAISGLDSGSFKHPLATRPPLLPYAPADTVAVQSNAPNFTTDCFPRVKTETYTTNGTFPWAAYKGNSYFFGTPAGGGCGYTPPEIYTAYNLTGLYNEGYNGAGQTIAIIDWCGSPTIQSDANAFSARFGLPPLTSSNFAITEVPLPSQCAGEDAEINIDVEWSHAVAPGANINLVVPPSASFQDVDEAESYIVNYGLGSVISGSYASVESETPLSVVQNENLIAEMAAVSGISANFSSGDDGDYSVFGIPPSVSAPADGTYATAVGGVTAALNSDNTLAWQTGWGNDETLLTSNGAIFNPPLAFGFVYGSGGGPSGVFTKPSFQSGVPGAMRQLPDISWLADPFTGVDILISVPLQSPSQVWLVYGGTSVACPMFSALWAIANQEAGVPLGQAAAYLYSMPAGTITDVTAASSTTNVVAAIHESSTSTNSFGAGMVMGGAAPGSFYSALADDPFSAFTTYVFSFGTDCVTVTGGFGTLCNTGSALRTQAGWDNVTGVGTPNGQAFADAFRP